MIWLSSSNMVVMYCYFKKIKNLLTWLHYVSGNSNRKLGFIWFGINICFGWSYMLICWNYHFENFTCSLCLIVIIYCLHCFQLFLCLGINLANLGQLTKKVNFFLSVSYMLQIVVCILHIVFYLTFMIFNFLLSIEV